MMSQTTSNATAPGNGSGGVNGTQVGLGVQAGSIDMINTVGAPQSTGRAMDFYISGQGYFMVKGSEEMAKLITHVMDLSYETVTAR